MSHPLLEQLDAALRHLVPGEPVHLSGEWLDPSRRTYRSGAQAGTGSGPFVDVVDRRWRGTLACRSPVGGIVLLVTADHLYWAKTPVISLALPIEITLSAYADYTSGRATFTATMAGAYLPGVPVSVNPDLGGVCTVHEGVVTTGRTCCVARTGSAAVFVVLFPRSVLKMGRKRLWRVHDGIASSLSADLRELLTRRRTGRVPAIRDPREL